MPADEPLIDRYGDPMGPAICTVSPVQIMGLWEDLMQCLYGDNKHGGDVAEIYLYRMMPHNPAATSSGPAAVDAYRLANRALHDLCTLFGQRNDCVVEMADGSALNALLGAQPNQHRVHLRVRREGAAS